jgi:hypothetical protein
MEPTTPEIDVKWESWTHFSYKCVIELKIEPINGLGEPSC